MNFLKTLLAVNKVKSQLTNLFKMMTSISRKVEALQFEIEELKEKSHPPVFTKMKYNNIDDRVQYIEAFIENLEKIAFNEKDVAN